MRSKHFLLILLVCFWVFSDLNAQSGHITYYVAPWGALRNPGTEKRPFIDPEQARNAVRLQKRKSEPGTRFTVVLRGGNYFFKKSMMLDSVDGGTEGAPVRWINYPGEQPVIHGGAVIPTKHFRPVTETELTGRLPKEARKKVYVLDTEILNINNSGDMKAHGFGRPAGPAPLELFINGARQQLARYPNSGKMATGKIIDCGSIPRNGDFSGRGGVFGYEDDRASSWAQVEDVWLHGWFSFGFNDDHLPISKIDTALRQIHLGLPHVYGLKSGLYVDTTRWDEVAGRSLRGFYAYNLPEEMDTPGEWWLDRQSGKLYLYPPEGFDTAKVEISLLEAPLLHLKNIAWLQLEGIHFYAARGMGVFLENANDITIDQCSFTALGTVAVSAGFPFDTTAPAWLADGSPVIWPARVSHFRRIIIRNCRVESTGAGGIFLQGGNRRDLTPSGHLVSGCTFRKTDERNFTFAPALTLTGVADTVRNCVFSDIRHISLRFSGNDHLFIQNRFERICTESDDIGAVYTGRDPSARGTIIRHNHFRDILPVDKDSQVSAIFLDDGTGGITIDSNYFERIGSQGDKQLFGAIAINGGFGNNIAFNVFEDCEIVIGNNHWTEDRWRQFLDGPLVRQHLFENVNINSPLYQNHYPDLKDYLTNFGPRLNRVADNTLINSNMAINGRLDLVFNHTASAKGLEGALQRIGMKKYNSKSNSTGER